MSRLIARDRSNALRRATAAAKAIRVGRYGIIALVIGTGLLAQSGCRREEASAEQAVRKATGGEPLNQITEYGRAAMPLNRVLDLPECEVWLNGKTSFRMPLDSGAGNTLMLSPYAAEAIELRTITESQVFGIGGAADVKLAMIDELRIGDICCRRVLTLVGAESSVLLQACDGVIGTGIFRDGRIQMDFAHAEFGVSPSGERVAIGQETTIEVTPAAHALGSVTLSGTPATVLFDSGANRSAISPRWLKKHLSDDAALEVPLPMMGVGTRVSNQRITAGADLVLAGRRLENLPAVALVDLDTVMSPRAEREIDLLIGMNVLRMMRSWTVDYARERMWIDWLDAE